ncbi:hypothetical protein GPL21_19495 [Bradyrhizobium pachyrhizi]|uniref:Sulfatase N-terminal domain-containing protein n=1 Tax=Bradyrhizobium pachyrhizi TaxID=280333 RepID=A0A844STE3_9BRAD|nr:hypothetical protein [Bradyrhizobium pachyrhizi]MVT67289.1 hypothetical protein [Bradyrhizobium pachyrhizi]
MKIGLALWRGLFAGVAAVTMAMPSTAQQQKRPNIVMLMTDDTGWNVRRPDRAAARRLDRQQRQAHLL